MVITTRKVPAWELEAGDTFMVGVVGDRRESREVLGVLQLTPMGGALLEVRTPNGNVHRSHVHGSVDVVDAYEVPAAGMSYGEVISAQTFRLTVGQRDALLAAGIVRAWGKQWGTPGYILAPGMTHEDVNAALT